MDTSSPSSIEQGTPLALITGASRGFGAALASALARHGWSLVIDARDAGPLVRVATDLKPAVRSAIAGDVSDPSHRHALADAVDAAVSAGGRFELVVHNASTLGPTPMRRLADLDADALSAAYAVNAVAPLALTQRLLPRLSRSRGTVVSLSSDAAVEAYETWGAYASSKAALDRLMAVLAAEEPAIRAYAFDPGDMRTQMHADAFPGEDISDRPLPESVVPTLLRLLDDRPPSGRYRAVDVALVAG